MGRVPRLLPYLIALGVAAWLHQGVSDYAHLGRDTWPLIATARVTELADFFGLFTKELMHGLYPDGSFYRPLTSLSYALDFALYGEAPRGYHVTDLLLFGLALCGAVSLAAPSRRRKTGLAVAMACGVLLALHPAVRDVVPLSSRRADLWTLAALLWAVRCSHGERARPYVAALLCLLACAAKESGFVAPLLVLGAAWSSREDREAAIRFAAPSFVVVALYFVARLLVLSGIGGPTNALTQWQQTPSAFFEILRAACAPRSALFPEELRTPATVLFLISTLEAVRHSKNRPWCVLLLFAAAASALLPASSGRFEAWYALTPAAFITVLISRLAHDAVGSATPIRLALPLILFCPAALLGSPLFESENPWLRATTRAARFEQALDQTLDTLPREAWLVPGGTGYPLNMPRVVLSTRQSDGSHLRTVPLYAPYSLVGRELLRERQGPVRFRLEDDPDSAEEGSITVRLTPRALLVTD